MRFCLTVICVGLLLSMAAAAWAVTYSWELVPTFADWSVPISSTDIIQGMKVGSGATIEAGGFHGAFPETHDAGRLTDGELGVNTDSVLADFSTPSIKIVYNFEAQPVTEIRSFGGNPAKDGRVFQDLDVEVLTPGGWFEIIREATTGSYYKSNGGQWEGSLIRVFEETGGPLLEGIPISGVRLTYYMVDNSGDWFLPRTDSGLNTSSIIKEIDVMPIPEPSSILALATGLAGMSGIVLRRKIK